MEQERKSECKAALLLPPRCREVLPALAQKFLPPPPIPFPVPFLQLLRGPRSLVLCTAAALSVSISIPAFNGRETRKAGRRSSAESANVAQQ